jgi:hypothetical protein
VIVDAFVDGKLMHPANHQWVQQRQQQSSAHCCVDGGMTGLSHGRMVAWPTDRPLYCSRAGLSTARNQVFFVSPHSAPRWKTAHWLEVSLILVFDTYMYIQQKIHGIMASTCA